MFLNINTDETVKFTKTLERLRVEALPEVVKQVLNRAAFDVKQKTMPVESNRFTKRKPTFFKANSTVIQAIGLDVKTMKSEVGFKPKPADRSHSVEDLEQQEYGGQIGNRAFIALASARSGNSFDRMVRKDLTMDKIGDDVVDSLAVKGANDRERFIKSAVHAGKGGFVLGTNRKKGARLLMRINSIKRAKTRYRNRAGKVYPAGSTMVNSTAVYSVKAGRRVTPDSRFNRFMGTASRKSARKMEADYVKIAQRKIRSLTVKNI